MSGASLLVEFEDAAELFRCLSSPVRVAVIQRLTQGAACVHDLVEELGLPQPLVSQHLRVLRGADLVTGHRRGREVTYALADEHVARMVRHALSHSTEGTSEEHHNRALDGWAAPAQSRPWVRPRLRSPSRLRRLAARRARAPRSATATTTSAPPASALPATTCAPFAPAATTRAHVRTCNHASCRCARCDDSCSSCTCSDFTCTTCQHAA